MDEHQLFNYIREMENGNYTGDLDGVKYHLNLTDPESDAPHIYIAHNDIRNYLGQVQSKFLDENFEKDGESIYYYRRSGDLCYVRNKGDVRSIASPNFTCNMRSVQKFKIPYPESIEKLLDRTLQLVRTAKQI